MLEDAAKALGIDIRNMSEGEMVRKIADLFDEIAIEDDAADDPAGDDPPAELSRKELAACKARGIAPEDFVQMKAEAARRVAPSKITKPAPAGPNAISQKEIAACRARGIDPKDFAARKAAAVRRV